MSIHKERGGFDFQLLADFLTDFFSNLTAARADEFVVAQLVNLYVEGSRVRGDALGRDGEDVGCSSSAVGG